MNAKEIVTNVLAESGVENAAENLRIKEDCGLDSLSLVSVIVRIEIAMGKAFDDGDLNPAELVTVGDVIALTEKYV